MQKSKGTLTMTIINDEAVLRKLGYTPNEPLFKKLQNIKNNTKEYEKIIKHLLDLHDALQVDKSYAALSNSSDFIKIKIEAQTDEMKQEALEKVERFRDKFKAVLQRVEGKDTFYLLGYQH